MLNNNNNPEKNEKFDSRYKRWEKLLMACAEGVAPAKHNGNEKVKVSNRAQTGSPGGPKRAAGAERNCARPRLHSKRQRKAGEDTPEREEEYKRARHAFRKQVRKDKRVHADTLNELLAELSSDPILSKDFWNKILSMAHKMTQI